MAGDGFDPTQVDVHDYIRLNGECLLDKTIPNEWILCEVVDTTPAEAQTGYQLDLQPIEGQKSGPITKFVLGIDTNGGTPQLATVNFVSRIMRGLNDTDVTDKSYLTTIEHFQHRGDL
jgi:hypothetical protein